jgi:hypothetical protein
VGKEGGQPTTVGRPLMVHLHALKRHHRGELTRDGPA